MHSATIRTLTGSTRSTVCAGGELSRAPGLRRDKPSADTLEHRAEPQLLHWCPENHADRPSAGRPWACSPLTGYRPFSLGLSEDAGFAGTSRSEKPLGQEEGCPKRRHKSAKLMGGATAQRMAIQPGGSEPPIPGLCKMGRRPNRFRLPSRTDSKLHIRLAMLSFRHPGRAH